VLITNDLLQDYDGHIDFLSKRPISEVFLDMDGVVTDWEKAACELMGIDMSTVNFKGDEKAVEKVLEYDDLVDEINKGYDEFFVNMPAHDHTNELMTACEEANGIILTAPMMKCPGVYSGKVEWVQRYWPDTDRIIVTKHKQSCAKPTALLIDDRKSSCEDFVTAGGNAIVFPSRIYDGHIDVDTVINLLGAIAEFNSPKLFS